jgi:hypothetical protein
MTSVPGLKESWVHVAPEELDGLLSVVQWIKGLPINKRSVPADIFDPDQLLLDAEVSKHLSSFFFLLFYHCVSIEITQAAFR